MKRSLRIAIADDEPDMRDFLEKFLPRLGHQVIAVAENGRQLLEQCAHAPPDLVVSDVRMPDLDGVAAAEALAAARGPIPVVLVTGYRAPDAERWAQMGHVFAYLVKPITEEHLGPAIELAIRRFEQFQTLDREVAELRRSLEDRKLIERAKGIVTRRVGLSESEAHRRLQRLARQNNRKLAELARDVLGAEETFAALEVH
jgi:response regulator NasT